MRKQNQSPTYAEVRAALESRIDAAVESFFTDAELIGGAPVWLYYDSARGSELCGPLFHAGGLTAESSKLADPEPIPRGIARAGVRAWIAERAGRLPILNPS